MRKLRFIVIFFSLLVSLNITQAKGMYPVNFNLIPTSETLGKGGYSLWSGMFPYENSDKTVTPIDVNVGGIFKEKHDVWLKSNIYLIPIRITYGLTEKLDLTFGGTYSIGNSEKSIKDYYEIGDETKERVYPQTVFDGTFGMKYNIQKSSGRVPSLAFGGELQMGYTIDNEFVDETLEDSFPFVGVLSYMSGGYEIGIVNVQGGLGMFLSSKSVQSNRRFDVLVQLGVEVPFNGFSAVMDVSIFRPYSGIGFENVVSGGFRYNFASNASINASVASVGGFAISLTIGGKKPEVIAPTKTAPSLF